MECICDLQTHTSIYFQFSKFQSSSPWPMGPWWRSLAKQCFFRMMKLTSPVPVQTIAPCSSQDFTKFTCGKEISDIAFLWYIYLPNSRWQGDPAPSVCCQIGWWPYLPDRWWVGRDWKSCIPRVGSGFLTIAYITDTHTHIHYYAGLPRYIYEKKTSPAEAPNQKDSSSPCITPTEPEHSVVPDIIDDSADEEDKNLAWPGFCGFKKSSCR